MQTTVRIEGVDYAPCERAQDGAYWGIQTPEKTFWVFPVCDENGNEIKSLPPYLPLEIRAVTHEPPDLTQRYPETVKDIFDKRRTYFARATLSEYVKQFPKECWLTEEQFKKEQDRILAEPLEDFARDPFLRSMVWNRHGTPELANECGYLGDMWETEISDDGTEHRISRHCSIAQSLSWAISSARKIGSDAAWAIVSKLKYVMIYEGVPTAQFIYLEEMKSATHAGRESASVPVLRRAQDSPKPISAITAAIHDVKTTLLKGFQAICDKLDGFAHALADVNVLTQAKLDQTHGAVTQFRGEQKEANEQTTKEHTEIKAGVEEVKKLTPAVEGLILRHEKLKTESKAGFEKAVHEALNEMKPAPLEREIIHLRWNCNMSYDRIVRELRQQKRGKTKDFVIEVCKRFDDLLKARGYKGKERVSGPAMAPKHGWEGGREDGEPAVRVPLEEEAVRAHLDEAEILGFVERWPKMSPKEQQEVLKYYPEIASALKKEGHIAG